MATVADDELPPLYRDCGKGGGSGTWNHAEKHGSSMSFHTGPCPDCESIGAIPSPEGKRILDLVQRWRRMGRL